MKRDMELVRKILLEMEDAPYTGGPLQVEGIDGYSQQEIAYHIMLLHEAGLMHAKNASTYGGADWRPVCLTWEGHEFLQAAKDDTRWNQAKDFLKSKGAPMIFELFKTLLISYASQAVFGKPTS